MNDHRKNKMEYCCSFSFFPVFFWRHIHQKRCSFSSLLKGFPEKARFSSSLLSLANKMDFCEMANGVDESLFSVWIFTFSSLFFFRPLAYYISLVRRKKVKKLKGEKKKKWGKKSTKIYSFFTYCGWSKKLEVFSIFSAFITVYQTETLVWQKVESCWIFVRRRKTSSIFY